MIEFTNIHRIHRIKVACVLCICLLYCKGDLELSMEIHRVVKPRHEQLKTETSYVGTVQGKIKVVPPSISLVNEQLLAN